MLLLALAWWMLAAAATPAQSPQSPRNIVLIIADDLGRDLGCYGIAAVRTPHLDVPIFRYVAPNTNVPGTLCNQSGREEKFSDEVLEQLYRNRGAYINQFVRRLNELQRDGWWPKEYANRYARDDAKAYAEELP